MMSGAGAGTSTGGGASPFYSFALTLSQFCDQVTARRASRVYQVISFTPSASFV